MGTQSTSSFIDESCYSNVNFASLPEPWVACVHPRGWLYFYNRTLKVVTDQDIRDPRTLELVEATIADYPIGALEDGMEVHLCHVLSPRDFETKNLFSLAINHNSCLASYDLEDVLPDNVCQLDPKRQNRFRRFYWNYLSNHPSHSPTPDRAIKDAIDALTYFHTDNLISGASSTSPFSKAECTELSAIVRDLAGTPCTDSPAKTMFLAWFLREVASFRASESYGEYTLKTAMSLKDEKLIPKSSRQRQPSPAAIILLNLVINCVFFGIPHTYWAHIKSTSEYRGRLAEVQVKWEKYIERLVREYSHFLLVSTVLLSATVGFLSIEDITEFARLAACVSALASLSSIIIGVFSIWRHQANTSRRQSYTYMHNIQQSFLGIPGHAIILGLPPSLLVWAIIGFTVAIVGYVVEGATTPDSWRRVAAWLLLVVFVLLLSIVMLALYTFSVIWTFQAPPSFDLKRRFSTFLFTSIFKTRNYQR
ncbi:hypothetical protein CC2G_010399 [Coprinopsis cinerea AmutBmut pab1-1]|nr:hypothetical protein CC2G_010399 [Coprinopsis cinerea AmutBmut pab1-1]